MSKSNSGGGANIPTGNGAGSTPIKKTSGVDWVKPAGAVGADEVAVKVSVSKLDEAWKRDSENYVGKEGGNQGKQKLENAKNFIRDPKRGGKKVPVEMPRATYDHKTGKVSFTDGRHRTAAARELGKRTMYISVPRITMGDVRNRLFDLIDATPNLDWLLLTKRPENIAAMMPPTPVYDRKEGGILPYWGEGKTPRPNVWIGTSVEDQATANERIPELLKIPAAVRFLSMEPLLGPVDLRNPFYGVYPERIHSLDTYDLPGGEPDDYQRQPSPRIHWVIVGGESGSKARAMDPAWARSLRDQCVESGTPYFFKQWGDISKVGCGLPEHPLHQAGLRVAQKKGGRILDGRTWDQFPEGGVR